MRVILRRLPLLVVTVALLLGGCSSSSSDSSPRPPRPDVRLGFTQLLPDEGTRHALLRVENLSDQPLAVTEAGLDWSGYGAFTSPQDATLAAGQTLDLQVMLPVPDCDSEPTDVVRGIVRTAGAETVQPLKGPDQDFVRRLHAAWCGDKLLAANVGIGYGDDWRVAGDVRRGEPAAVGSLVLTRRDGTEPVEVRSSDGTVLYDFAVRTPATLSAERSRLAVPAEILPGNRCDEHARGQATAPFTLALYVRVGESDDARDVRVLVEPPARVRNLTTHALDLACELRAAGG